MAATRVLVTGATGFVGSHLARRMVRDGWQVHIVCRPDSNLECLREALSQVTVHRHDGSTNNLIAIMEEVQPDVVFHLASLFISEHQPGQIEPLVCANLLFATQLAESMSRCHVKHLVNTGTSWQHYRSDDYNPVNLYAATKQAFEDILRYYIEACDFQVITLKLFDTYGPDDPRPKLFHLLEKIARESTTLAMSPGEQMIDLVFIDDVVQAFVMAAERLMAGDTQGHESYAVSSGDPLPLRKLVEAYGRITNKHISIEWGGRPYRTREVMSTWKFGERLPGWIPKVNIEKGISSLNESISF
jgi:nucleoside-diphosphate-sugar epimerase